MHVLSRLNFCGARKPRGSDASSIGTNTEKPAEMPLPVSRGRRQALLQRKNAAPSAAFSQSDVDNTGPASF
jgi:hypothetical protein